MSDAKDRVIKAIEEFGLSLRQRAPEIDAAGHLPADIVTRLRAIGIYRMLVPRSHGGWEIDFPDAVEIIAALARIDASMAWNVAVGAGGALMTALLPRETYDHIYRNSPDVIAAGSTQPAGIAERVKSGWRIKGRWPLVSGAHEADWIGGLCVMTENGRPLPNPSGGGAPWAQIAVFPARDWQIEDTWQALGLKGTGSVHAALAEAIVPDDRMLDPMSGRPCIPGPLYQNPMPLLPLLQAAVAVGNAEGALGDLIERAASGWQQQRPVGATKDSEYFQGELGRIATDVSAARAMLIDSAGSHWRQVLAGNAQDPTLPLRATQAGIWTVKTCVRSIDACYSLGGSGVIFEASPLQRRLRDMLTSSQHALVQARHYVDVGKMLLQTA